MREEKTARNSGNYSTPKTSTSGDVKIITEFDRATLVGGLIVAISFGLMMVIGAWFGWA